MSFDPNILQIGGLYNRTQLALLWGYKSRKAIERGVVTPSGSKYIILFVTRVKEKSARQYLDFINGDFLHWDGEDAHGSDERLATVEERGEEIYLFYRDIYRTPFRYYGRIFRTNFIRNKTEPSKFIFTLEHDLGPTDDIGQAKDQLAFVSETEREVLIKARLGQGKFRDDLFSFWNGCAVTNIQKPEILRASHIKPWRISENEERLNPYNGLLLLPQYDLLFDRGYISFDPRGRLIRSPAIESLPSEKLGIDLEVKIRTLSTEHQPFLEYHRSEVFFHKE